MLDEVIWIIPGQILCAQLSGMVDRAQIQELNQTCLDLLNAEALPPSAHIIIDVSDVTQYERDMFNVQLLQNVVDHHPLVDWIVIVDPNPNAIVRFVGLTLVSLMKFRCHVAKTRHDAVAFIVPKLKHSAP
jgi:hypothetical protein